LYRLLGAYGVRAGGRTPTGTELAAARAGSGVQHLHLDIQKGAARLENGAGIEEGGFAKGYALDRMKDQLAGHGIGSGLLDFGGQLLAFGAAVDVSIAAPKDRTRPRVFISLKEASLATSGLSEHGRHIVDPRSGRLCADWGSVSVITASALDADCLSTALYVMGPERGLAWAKRHSIAAIFLSNDRRVRMSPAFAALHPTLTPLENP
jgi:thiamine biosynthesis lipoprotein